MGSPEDYSFESQHGLAPSIEPTPIPVDFSFEIGEIYKNAEFVKAYELLFCAGSVTSKKVRTEVYQYTQALITEARYLYSLCKTYIDHTDGYELVKHHVETLTEKLDAAIADSCNMPSHENLNSALQILEKPNPFGYESFIAYLAELVRALSEVIIFCSQMQKHHKLLP